MSRYHAPQDLDQTLDSTAGAVHDAAGGDVETPISGMDVDAVGDEDSHSFQDAKIPVISLHSLDNDTLQLIHGKRDRLEAIQFEQYFASYRLIAFFLAYLDAP